MSVRDDKSEFDGGRTCSRTDNKHELNNFYIVKFKFMLCDISFSHKAIVSASAGK